MTIVRIIHKPKRPPPRKRPAPVITKRVVEIRSEKAKAADKRWARLTGRELPD